MDWKFSRRLVLAINQIIRMLALFIETRSIIKPSWLGSFGEDGYKPHSVKWSLAESRGTVWRFCRVSGTDFVLIFRVFDWESHSPHEDGDGVTPRVLNTMQMETESLLRC